MDGYKEKFMSRDRIKSKIKFALKEDSIAKKNTRWDPDTQPNIYQLDIFLRKSGYRLFDVVINKGHPELMIETIKEGHLHPEINHNVADQAFYIEVKKYGELSASDVEEIVKGYQTAIGVVKHLEKLDLNKLELKGE